MAVPDATGHLVKNSFGGVVSVSARRQYTQLSRMSGMSEIKTARTKFGRGTGTEIEFLKKKIDCIKHTVRNDCRCGREGKAAHFWWVKTGHWA